jgi:uridine phosphorylase
MGFDGLMNFYEFEKVTEHKMEQAFIKYSHWPDRLNHPYIVKGSSLLEEKLGAGMKKGITATACGFYAPQGRSLRLKPYIADINTLLTGFQFENNRITNFEMETSALFGLSKLLGHEATTICVIVANRIKKEFSKDYKTSVKNLIETVLERL